MTSPLDALLQAAGGAVAGALAATNGAPTAVALTNTVSSLNENTATASHIKVADIVVTDDGFGTNTFGLAGADAAFFEIVGTSLYIKAGTVLNYEAKTSYAIAVTVDDPLVGTAPDATSAAYTLSVGNVVDTALEAALVAIGGVIAGALTPTNQAPTGVVLTNTVTSIDEHTATASHLKVADIAVIDDAVGTNTLGLTGVDAAFFEIVGASLYIKAGTVLDFVTKASYAVAVTVDDPDKGGTPDASVTYTLALGEVTDPSEKEGGAVGNQDDPRIKGVHCLPGDEGTMVFPKSDDRTITGDLWNHNSTGFNGCKLIEIVFHDLAYSNILYSDVDSDFHYFLGGYDGSSQVRTTAHFAGCIDERPAALLGHVHHNAFDGWWGSPMA